MYAARLLKSLGLIALLTVGSLALYGADSKNVDKRVPLSASGSVTIDSHNGSIHVSTWDRPEIEIHARIEAGGSSAEDRRRFDQTNVEIDSSRDSVRIKSKHPDWNFSWWGNSGSSPQIHYTITAPRTAQWRISDHNSKIEVRDLHAALDINTHNSSVRVTGQSGPVTLSTHNGNANIDFASFAGPTSIEMHNGSAELTMPSSSKFDLHSSTHNGNVNSDFAVLARTSGRRSLAGPVNGGGPALRLSSHNGNFRLRTSNR